MQHVGVTSASEVHKYPADIGKYIFWFHAWRLTLLAIVFLHTICGVQFVGKVLKICKNYIVVWVPKKLDAHLNKSTFIKFFWFKKADIRDVIRLINFAIMKRKFLAIMKGTQWQAQDTQSIVSML